MNLSHCASQLLTGKTCKNCAYKNGFTYVDRKNYEFKNPEKQGGKLLFHAV
ncbi:MAG: hypothetical protein L6V85_07270 [Clostridiales bacterium]|nr:MAG: hypothetical protein L6V85_07270 [Clostridiales bacterium]